MLVTVFASSCQSLPVVLGLKQRVQLRKRDQEAARIFATIHVTLEKRAWHWSSGSVIKKMLLKQT